MSKRAAQHDEFDSHRDTILQLYKDHTREEVQIFMGTQHGFKRTKTQYENAFRRWQNKKNLSRDDWRFIANRIRGLDEQGNLPKVYICGASEPLSDSKVRKGISRHGHQTTLEKVKLARSQTRAVTPPYIRISTTPQPSCSESTIEDARRISSEYVVLDARLMIENFREWARRTPCWQLVDFIKICVHDGISLHLRFPPDSGNITTRSFAYNMMQDVFFFTFVEPAIFGIRRSALSWHQPNDFLPPSPANMKKAIDIPGDSDLANPSTQLEFLKLAVMLLANRLDYGVTGGSIADNMVKLLYDKHDLSTFGSLLQEGLLSVRAAAEKLLGPAVIQGHLELVAMILDSGADVNIRFSNDGWIPEYVLPYAIRSGRDDMVKLLLHHGADSTVVIDHCSEILRELPKDFRGYSMLNYTVQCGNPNMLCDILRSQARSEAIDFDAVSRSLEMAIRANRMEMFDWLMYATNSFATFKALGGSMFGSAIACANISTVSALVYRGFNISCRHFSILPNAIQLNRSPEFIQSLLEMGANVDGTGTDSRPTYDEWLESSRFYAHGMTALHCALHMNDTNLIRLLLDYGADANKLCASVAPIQVAAAFSDTVAMAMLLGAGATVDAIAGSSRQHNRTCRTPRDWSDLACLNAIELSLRRGEKDIVDLLLRSGASLDESATQDLLYSALVGCNRELVTVLLEAKSVHMLTSSVIEIFLGFGEWDVLKQLIYKGTFYIDDSTKSAVNIKVIKTAIKQRRHEFVRYILSPLNIFGRLSSGLAHAGAIYAIRYHNFEMLELLLDWGCRPFTLLAVEARQTLKNLGQFESNLYLLWGDTLLIRAAKSFKCADRDVCMVVEPSCRAYMGEEFESSRCILALLVEHRGSPLEDVQAENQRKRALAQAIAFLVASQFFETPELIQILLAAGIHLVDAERFLPYSFLQLALASFTRGIPSRNFEVVEFLLESEVCVNSPVWSDNYHTYFHTALYYASGLWKPDLVRQLLVRGAYVHTTDTRCDEPMALSAAVSTGDIRTVKLLLEHQAQHGLVPTVDRYASELQVAVARRDSDCFRLLLEYGAQVDAAHGMRQASTALQYAVKNNDTETVEILIARQADVNAAPAASCGATALQYAAFNGNFAILRILLESGASINAAPAHYDGRTAIEGAAEHGRLDMVLYLLEAGAHVHGKNNQNYRRTVYRAWKRGHRTLVHMLQDFKVKTFGPSDCDTEEEIVRSMTSDMLHFASEEIRKKHEAEQNAFTRAEEVRKKAEREAALHAKRMRRQECLTITLSDDEESDNDHPLWLIDDG